MSKISFNAKALGDGHERTTAIWVARTVVLRGFQPVMVSKPAAIAASILSGLNGT